MDGARQWKTGVLRLGPIEMEVDHDRDPALPAQPGLRTLRGAGRRGLTRRERFADHSRETFDAAIGTARSIAEKYFAPHNRKSDEHEPVYQNGEAVLIPEVKPAVDAFIEAGFHNAQRSFDDGGMQLPNLLSRACFAHFQSANIATSSYPMLSMGASHLIETFGSEEQKRRFLQPMLEGRLRHHGAYRAACRLLAIGHPHPRRTGRRR